MSCSGSSSLSPAQKKKSGCCSGKKQPEAPQEMEIMPNMAIMPINQGTQEPQAEEEKGSRCQCCSPSKGTESEAKDGMRTVMILFSN